MAHTRAPFPHMQRIGRFGGEQKMPDEALEDVMIGVQDKYIRNLAARKRVASLGAGF